MHHCNCSCLIPLMCHVYNTFRQSEFLTAQQRHLQVRHPLPPICWLYTIYIAVNFNNATHMSTDLSTCTSISTIECYTTVSHLIQTSWNLLCLERCQRCSMSLISSHNRRQGTNRPLETHQESQSDVRWETLLWQTCQQCVPRLLLPHSCTSSPATVIPSLLPAPVVFLGCVHARNEVSQSRRRAPSSRRDEVRRPRPVTESCEMIRQHRQRELVATQPRPSSD